MPEKEKEVKKDKKEESKKDEVAQLKEEVASLKAEVEKWKNSYYMAYADTKNLRSSLEKEHRNAMKYRAEGFIDNLLPVLDSFYMALGNEPTDPNLKNYLVGFQFIYRNLVAALENEGVSEIEPVVGKEFDADTMNAVDTVEVPDDEQENLVKRVYAKGYKLHDRLIRPANVTVGKHKEKVTEDNKEETKPAEEASENIDA